MAEENPEQLATVLTTFLVPTAWGLRPPSAG
jgi:hypothetical protein